MAKHRVGDWPPSSGRWRAAGIVIPGIQIGSAGVTFLGWAYLARTSTRSYQIVPVQAFSVSAILALVVPLGIPYIAPNYFRTVDPSQWRGRGPWSPLFSAAGACCLLAFLVGDVISITLTHSQVLQTAAASLTSGALTATSILCLQATRLNSDLRGMFVASLAGPIVPAIWVVLGRTDLSTERNVLIFSALQTVSGLALLYRIRPLLQPRLGIQDIRAAGFVGAALLMIPHLLAFSILMQGMRLTSIVLGRDGLLLKSHDLMLIASIGTTLIIGFHSLISVRMQSSTEQAYRKNWWRFASQYGALGMLSSTAALIILLAASRTLPELPTLSTPLRIVFCSTLPSVAAYYSLSSQCLRIGKTSYLALTSVSTVTMYYAASVIVPGSSMISAVEVFAGAMLFMPLALISIILIRGRNERAVLIARGLGLTALGYVPCLALLVIYGAISL
jgi:hypothetical protein